ncbi:hypothetical protein ABZP36_024863 [Zizania latifolia]
MSVMGKLRVFVVQEPVVAASCLIAGFGILSLHTHHPPILMASIQFLAPPSIGASRKLGLRNLRNAHLLDFSAL